METPYLVSLALNAFIVVNKLKCSFSDYLGDIAWDCPYITYHAMDLETLDIASGEKMYSTFPKHA